MPGPTTSPGPAVSGLRLVGYFQGLDRNDHVSDIPADRLTDVIYAFVNVSHDGKCVSADTTLDQINFPQLQQLKKSHPQLKLLLSIGGYSHSANFSDAAATDTSRRTFAQSCVQFMQVNGFDGLDIDWELPVSGGMAGNGHRPEDKQNFTALLAELRRQLDELGSPSGTHDLLTIAAPIGPSEYKNIELNAIAPYLDWIDLMAYAFYTANSPITNFNAPLYASATDPAPPSKRLYLNGDAAVKAYRAAGVPANKIVLGAPLYGRGWQGVPDVNHGLYQSDSGPAADSTVPNGVWQDGAITYGNLVKYYLSGAARFWQPETQEPWLYDSKAGIMITYEDPQSLAAKAGYVVSHQLGGIMIWHVSYDDTSHTLVNALYSNLYP